MTPLRPFQALIDEMPPKKRARLEAAKLRLDDEGDALIMMDLEELRRTCDLSQEQIAGRLDTQQAQISSLERRNDLLVSTLRRYVDALGGHLEIRAVFPGWTVQVVDFMNLPPFPPRSSFAPSIPERAKLPAGRSRHVARNGAKGAKRAKAAARSGSRNGTRNR